MHGGAIEMKVYIEFRIPNTKPTNILCKEIEAINLEDARQIFAIQHPSGQILKIEGRVVG